MEFLDEVTRSEFDELCKKNYNDAQVFKRLIENKDFFNRQFSDGNTPLLAALHHEHINPYLIQDLLKNSNIQAKDKDGKTSLEISLEKKVYFVAYLLIKKGAVLNVSFNKFHALSELFDKNTFADKDNHIREEISKYFEAVKGEISEHTQPLAKDTAQPVIKDFVEPVDSTHSVTAEVMQEVDQSDLSPITQVLKAMVNREVVTVDDKEYRKALYQQMNWTALRTKKVSVDDLQGIATVLSDIHKGLKSDHPFELHHISPNVQNAIFNIVAYAGKLSTEKPSKFSKLNKIKDDKYNVTIDFLKSILTGGPETLELKVQEYMNKQEIKASRGSKFYKLHGLFSGKGFDVQSTMQELFHDLNKVLEEENSHDSTLEL